MRDVPCAPAPEPRCRHSAHIIGEKMIVFGGYNGTLPFVPPHAKFQNPNVGSKKLSKRKQGEKLAGGDRRHGD